MCIRFLIGFLLLGVFSSFSTADIAGGYVGKNQQGYKEGYYFWNDTKEFSWFRYGEKTMELGRGNYALVRDSIVLDFGPARKQFDVDYSAIMIFPGVKGGESITMTFTNNLNEPLEGLEIKLKKSGMKAVTGKDGKAFLDMSNTNVKKDEVTIQIEGYRTVHPTLDLKGWINEIHVVADLGRTYKENQTVKLLYKPTKKGIEFSDNHTLATFLKSVSRDKFMDLYHGFDPLHGRYE